MILFILGFLLVLSFSGTMVDLVYNEELEDIKLLLTISIGIMFILLLLLFGSTFYVDPQEKTDTQDEIESLYTQ